MKFKNFVFIIILSLALLMTLLAAEKKLTISDGNVGDSFGFSVAVNDSFAVISAPYQTAYSGVVYIFYKDAGGTEAWGQVAKIYASDSVAYDMFGNAVAVSGNYIAVGSMGNSGAASLGGAVYLFKRSGSGAGDWTQVKKIVCDDIDADYYFGTSVAMKGDTLVAGATGADANTGAAYVFYRNQGGTDNWGQVKKLQGDDSAADDDLGVSVSLYNGKIIAGADYASSAYVFYRDEGGTDNWGQKAKLSSTASMFGSSVAIADSFAVVGASTDNKVFVFGQNTGGTNNWGSDTTLLASDSGNSCAFGFAVSLYKNDLLVSDNGYDEFTGKVYGFLYYSDEKEWREKSATQASDAATYSYYGNSVSIYGDNAAVGTDGAEEAYVYKCYDDLSLPVELLSFTAQGGDGFVELNWVTASEVNNDAFLVQRSENGKDFMTIAEIPGQGSVTVVSEYAYRDNNVINGVKYYYRLADRDFSGTITYHNVVSVRPLEITKISAFILEQNYPNPFNPYTNINFTVPNSGGAPETVEIAVYNGMGQKVYTVFNGELEGGNYTMSWNGKNYSGKQVPSGIYFLHLRSNSVVLTKKMLLLK